MFIRAVLRYLLVGTTLIIFTAAASAQARPAAPVAVRVRVAHLAPFTGSDSATIAITIDGAAAGGTMAYGGHSDYIGLAGGEGERLIEVLRDGAVIISETRTLTDGDHSVVVIGNDNLVPLSLLVLDENVETPSPGRAGLRITHVAVIGATIDETRVDVCSQEGVPFSSNGASLRYPRTTGNRLLLAGDYDLKITRTNDAGDCAGTVLIDPPSITLAEGTKTNLFLVGDGVNRTLAVFTFAAGLIGDDGPPPSSGKLFLPLLAGS